MPGKIAEGFYISSFGYGDYTYFHRRCRVFKCAEIEAEVIFK